MPASDGRGNRLNYNGTEVFDVLTKGVSETVVYDPSNTDRVATQVEISLTGLLSVAGVDDGGAATVDKIPTSSTPPEPQLHAGTGLEGSVFDRTLQRLNENRKWFIYWVGDHPLYAVWPIEFWHLRHGEIDAAYCPSGVAENFVEENWWSAGLYDSAKIETSIVNIVSDRTARVEISITFTYIPCKTDKGFELSATANPAGGSPFGVAETEFVATSNEHSQRVGDTLKAWQKPNEQDQDGYKGSEYGLCQEKTGDDSGDEGLMQPTWESILSNKWKTADNINTEDWLCERTISGTIEIVGRVGGIDSHLGPDPDANAKKAPISPHYIRFVTIPPLQNGFKRHSLNFSEQDDNLKLDYEIKDKEVYVQSPWPACTFDASSSTSLKPLSGGMGSMPLVKVECSLGARKHVDKKLLLQAMVHVMNTKTNFLQTVSAFSCFPSAFEVSESLSSNQIKGSLEVMLKPDATGSDPFKSVMKFLTATFGQGTSDRATKGYKAGDEYRGLTSANLPQKGWGAPEEYDPQKARKDLQYPDDCYLLGPLSSLFMPSMIAKHGLKSEGGTAHPISEFSHVGNSPCDPIISYDTKPKKVMPWIRTNTLDSGDIYEGHGGSDRLGNYSRDDWQSKGKVANPSSVYQEKPMPNKGRDFILGNPNSDTIGPFKFPYLVYNIHVQYEVKHGREMITSSSPLMPLTFPHSKTRPVAYKIFKFMAARINRRPVVPSAVDFTETTSNLRHYIIDSKYNFANPVPSSNGLTMLYIVSGMLIYALPRPHLASEPIFNPTAPDVNTGTRFPDLNMIHFGNFAPINDLIFYGF